MPTYGKGSLQVKVLERELREHGTRQILPPSSFIEEIIINDDHNFIIIVTKTENLENVIARLKETTGVTNFKIADNQKDADKKGIIIDEKAIVDKLCYILIGTIHPGSPSLAAPPTSGIGTTTPTFTPALNVEKIRILIREKQFPRARELIEAQIDALKKEILQFREGIVRIDTVFDQRLEQIFKELGQCCGFLYQIDCSEQKPGTQANSLYCFFTALSKVVVSNTPEECNSMLMWLEKAVEFKLDFVEAIYWQGLIHLLVQNYDQAIICFEKAVCCYLPTDALEGRDRAIEWISPETSYSCDYQFEDRDERCVFIKYQSVFLDHPKGSDVYYYLAIAKKQKHDENASHIHFALAYYWRGLNAAGIGNYRLALENHCTIPSSYKINSLENMYRVGVCLWVIGDWNNALEFFHKAIYNSPELRPSQLVFFAPYIKLLLKVGEYNKAIEQSILFISHYRRLYPQGTPVGITAQTGELGYDYFSLINSAFHLIIRCIIGDALFILGRDEESVESYLEAFKGFSTNPGALFIYGNDFIRQRQTHLRVALNKSDKLQISNNIKLIELAYQKIIKIIKWLAHRNKKISCDFFYNFFVFYIFVINVLPQHRMEVCCFTNKIHALVKSMKKLKDSFEEDVSP